MATRAEQFRSKTNRHGPGPKSRVASKKPKKAEWGRSKAHAASKATHALEQTAPNERPSRESSRASANRAKADAAMNLTEEKTKNSPESRARRSRVKSVKVRGHAS